MINFLSWNVSHDCVHGKMVYYFWFCGIPSWVDMGPSNIGIDFVLLDSVTSEIVNPWI